MSQQSQQLEQPRSFADVVREPAKEDPVHKKLKARQSRGDQHTNHNVHGEDGPAPSRPAPNDTPKAQPNPHPSSKTQEQQHPTPTMWTRFIGTTCIMHDARHMRETPGYTPCTNPGKHCFSLTLYPIMIGMLVHIVAQGYTESWYLIHLAASSGFWLSRLIVLSAMEEEPPMRWVA